MALGSTKRRFPPDKPAYSLRLAMTDTTEQRLHDILEAAGSGADAQSETLAGKAGAFYRAFMDEAAVEKLGATPIASQLAEIKGAKSPATLGALMGRNGTDFEHSIFLYGIDVDLKDPNHYAFYLTQGGLGLPDRDYYLKPTSPGRKTAYQNYVTTILRLLDWPERGEARCGSGRFRDKNCRGELDQGATTRSDRDLQSNDAG